MRSYGQECALAKALDSVGERWTLLIVRELMIRDGCRYTDLRQGLPGIPTNLLADRLEAMEEAGLVLKEAAPPPVATHLFRLTPRGRELEPVIAALGRWGAPLLQANPGKDTFCDHWVALPLRLYVHDRAPQEPAVTLALHAGQEQILLGTVGDGSVRVQSGRTAQPDARIVGNPYQILRLLTGKLKLQDARTQGLRYEGDAKLLRRFGAA